MLSNGSIIGMMATSNVVSEFHFIKCEEVSYAALKFSFSYELLSY